MIRIIDNKKVDITDDEFDLYKKICESYKSNGGASLFHDLFESDDNGIILFLKPPTKNLVSYEIIFFIMYIFQHQHIRLMHKQSTEIKDAAIAIISSYESKLQELENKIKDMEDKIK